MNYKVSVIIPVFNTEKFVERAISSIQNQTLKDIEIIIIDDGSTDSSLSIIKKLAQEDNRIQIVSNPNNGLSISRNIGIYKSNGEYIYFFDSDDELDSRTLELCYNKCQKDNLDFIFFDADVFTNDDIDTNGFNYIRANKYEDKTYLGCEILKKQLSTGGYRSSACLNLINKKFLDSIKLYFYPKILHEDELFTFILYLKAQKVGLYNEKFFHRRIRKASIMTSKFNRNRVDGYLTVCRELHCQLQRYNIPSTTKQLLKERIYYILQVIINNMDRTNIEYYNEIKNIITHEFKNCIPHQIYLKLKYPLIYNMFIYRFFKK